jgi:hypothetical protein
VSQERFTNLAILSVENEVASYIDFSNVVNDFAAIKPRKVQFSIFDQCDTRELICHQMKEISGSDCDFLNTEFLMGGHCDH